MTAPALKVYVNGQQITVSGDNLNTFQQTCNSVDDMRGFIGTEGAQVYMRGYTSPNDGGQGPFYWNVSGTGPDDSGVTNIVPNGASVGCWTRLDTVLTQSGVTIHTTPSGINSIVLTPTASQPSITVYADFQSFGFYCANTTTGSVTINYNGLGALNAYSNDGTTQLGQGALQDGVYYVFAYNSTLNSNAGGMQLISFGSYSGAFTVKGSLGVGIDPGSAQQRVHIFNGALCFTRYSNTTTGIGANDGSDIGLDASGNLYLLNKEALSTIIGTSNLTQLYLDATGRLITGGGTSPAAGYTAQGCITLPVDVVDLKSAIGTIYAKNTAKAWLQGSYSAGTPTVNTSFNVTGFSDDGTGFGTATFTNALGSNSYVVAGDCQRAATDSNSKVSIKQGTSPSSTTVVLAFTATAALEDPSQFGVVIFSI